MILKMFFKKSLRIVEFLSKQFCLCFEDPLCLFLKDFGETDAVLSRGLVCFLIGVLGAIQTSVLSDQQLLGWEHAGV
jgi:hypothetical protein